MQIRLSREYVRILNECFAEAQGLADEEDYEYAAHAFHECERTVAQLQSVCSGILTHGLTAIGAVFFALRPGLGALGGRAVGGFVGRVVGKELARRGYYQPGTLQAIADLAALGVKDAQDCLSEQLEGRHQAPLRIHERVMSLLRPV